MTAKAVAVGLLRPRLGVRCPNPERTRYLMRTEAPGETARRLSRLRGADRSAQRRRGRVSAAARRIASIERSTSSLVVAQLETEMRIASMPCQVVPLSQQVPSF